MFPHWATHQIEHDLRQTGNVELFVGNILNNRLTNEGNAAALEAANFSSENESESEYESDNQSESATNDQETSSSSGQLVQEDDGQLLMEAYLLLNDESPSCGQGGRFSKMTEEREVMLDVRKRQLIMENRKKYLATPPASDLQEIIKNVQQKIKSMN